MTTDYSKNDMIEFGTYLLQTCDTGMKADSNNVLKWISEQPPVVNNTTATIDKLKAESEERVKAMQADKAESLNNHKPSIGNALDAFSIEFKGNGLIASETCECPNCTASRKQRDNKADAITLRSVVEELHKASDTTIDIVIEKYKALGVKMKDIKITIEGKIKIPE